MKIALLGYGRMGKAIAAIATERGHEVAVTIDNASEWEERIDQLRLCDLAIDFSTPATAIENIEKCFALDLPLVIGTTGWYDHLDEMVEKCRKGNHALFMASNFSIGMNITFELNRRLAQLMHSQPSYSASISETHHIHKLDAPSGTAISLANDIIERQDKYRRWALSAEATTEDTLPITAIREGEIAGIHEVVWDSDIDTISIRHSAKSRTGLALGAVLAAEYLLGKNGYYTMRDLLTDNC